LEDEVPWRIALASIDGILVTEHFGRTRWFYVVDVQRDGTGVAVERRESVHPCQTGGHSEGGMEQAIAALKDCVAVLAARIGPGAKRQMELAGITPFEEPAIAEEAYQKLAAYYNRIKFPENV
jgi:predicted Fe-Mo cluster-binding NifX family protein